ncbi:hypothetical protein EF910_36410 [Streptomyces sp. WAC07149]|nr:hypothetical protein EF910_36410 [Streptomyces sp. WAC07149]
MAGPAELAQSPVNPAGLGTGRRRGRDGDDAPHDRPVPPQGTAMPALPPVPSVPPVPVTEHPAGRRRALGPAGAAAQPIRNLPM